MLYCAQITYTNLSLFKCIKKEMLCDNLHCNNGRESVHCVYSFYVLYEEFIVPPPAIITFIKEDWMVMTPIKNLTGQGSSDLCPDTHFQCTGGGYCMPVYMLCNGIHDCPNKDDESGCEHHTCHGFYRCRNSKVCLHPQHLCDTIHQCPLKDDEAFCSLVCVQNCTCYGRAFFCNNTEGLLRAIESGTDLQVRFLDASRTRMTPADLVPFSMMVYLNLCNCSLSRLGSFKFDNLLRLHLCDNLITSVSESHFKNLPNLKDLYLDGNPLLMFQDEVDLNIFQKLRTLDLSRMGMTSVDRSLSKDDFPELEMLNLSGNTIQSVSASGFKTLPKLKTLDLRRCSVITFPQDIFQGLSNLQTLLVDNYKLCCPALLPDGFNVHNCVSPQDSISSCEDLLQSNFYRVMLLVFSLLALLGNCGSFIFRLLSHRRSQNKSFHLFVTHLCVADFVMGIYLAIIGVADQMFRGSYLWEDVRWRHSIACGVAGFLSLLSSEVSACIISLITLDRFLVLRFPLSSVHFGLASAVVAVVMTWCLGMVLAAVPVLPATQHWRLYGQNAICVPLPVTGGVLEAGQGYSFSVMVVMNLILFLLIALGQLSIYWSVRVNSLASCTRLGQDTSKDLTVARRLITVAMSDFLCWFPVGLLGILAARGVHIAEEVYVAMAIFVLPLNSALNPFLYTLNVIMERRERAREQRLRAFFLSQVKAIEAHKQ